LRRRAFSLFILSNSLFLTSLKVLSNALYPLYWFYLIFLCLTSTICLMWKISSTLAWTFLTSSCEFWYY
jgi:hypothetical protein